MSSPVKPSIQIPIENLLPIAPEDGKVENCPMSLLPDELLLLVLDKLPPAAVATLGQTCRTWNRLSKDDGLWEKIYLDRFSHAEPSPELRDLLSGHYRNRCKISVINQNVFKTNIRNSERPASVRANSFSFFHLSDSQKIQLYGNLLCILSETENARIQFKLFSSPSYKRNALRNLSGVVIGRPIFSSKITFLSGEERFAMFENRFYTVFDGKINVWDVITGECLKILQVEGFDERNIRKFKIDQGRFCAVDAKGTTRVWELATGKCLFFSHDCSAMLNFPLFAFQGNYLLAGDVSDEFESEKSTNEIKILNITTGELHTHSESASILCVQILGDCLFVSTENEMKVLDLSKKECILTKPHATVRRMREGGVVTEKNPVKRIILVKDRLYFQSFYGHFIIWDAVNKDMSSFGSAYDKDNPVRSRQLENRKFYFQLLKDRLEVLNLKTGKSHVLKCENTSFAYEGNELVSTSGNNLVVFQPNKRTINVWNLETQLLIKRFEVDLPKKNSPRWKCNLALADDLILIDVTHFDDNNTRYTTLKIYDTTGKLLPGCNATAEGEGWYCITEDRLLTYLGKKLKIEKLGKTFTYGDLLHLLEADLSLLKDMASPTEDTNVRGLFTKLNATLQFRLKEYCRDSGASSELSPDVILQVQAEVCVDALLLALAAKQEEKVKGLFDLLKSINPKHTARLARLLWMESGALNKGHFLTQTEIAEAAAEVRCAQSFNGMEVDFAEETPLESLMQDALEWLVQVEQVEQEWGERAFHNDEDASIESKIRAAQKFRAELKGIQILE